MDMCTISQLSVDGNDLVHAGHSNTLLVGMRINECAQKFVKVVINRVVVCQVVRSQGLAAHNVRGGWRVRPE